MPTRREWLYWDSNVFLSYFNAENPRIQVLDALLQEMRASQGCRMIITSTYTIAEVVYVRAGSAEATDDQEMDDVMDFLWRDSSLLRFADLTQGLAQHARQLQRVAYRQGRTLDPDDAIHVATASWLQVPEMHTYDSGLLSLDGQYSFRIREPYVRDPRLL